MAFLFSARSAPSSTPTVTSAIGLIAVGYWLGSNRAKPSTVTTTTLDDIERIVDAIVVPLYGCLVATYITLRIYHVLIESKLRPKKEAVVIKPKSILPPPIPTDSGQPINLTGPFQLISNDNFEDFLAAQGVPWALRGAANKCRPTHRITHVGNSLTIQIQGIIESQTTYTINGPAQANTVRGRRFEDTVTYIESGVQTLKRAIDDGYTVQVRRVLSNDQTRITMTSTVMFDDKEKKNVACTQIFERLKQ